MKLQSDEGNGCKYAVQFIMQDIGNLCSSQAVYRQSLSVYKYLGFFFPLILNTGFFKGFLRKLGTRLHLPRCREKQCRCFSYCQNTLFTIFSKIALRSICWALSFLCPLIAGRTEAIFISCWALQATSQCHGWLLAAYVWIKYLLEQCNMFGGPSVPLPKEHKEENCTMGV